MKPEAPEPEFSQCPAKDKASEEVTTSWVNKDAMFLKKKVKENGGNQKQIYAFLYKEAWSLVFNKLPPFKKEEVKMFTEKKIIDNRFYTEFVQQVSSLVEDTLSYLQEDHR